MHVRAELDVLTEADENGISISIHLYASLSLCIYIYIYYLFTPYS